MVSEKEKKKAREWYWKNHKKCLKNMCKYRQTTEGKERRKVGSLKYEKSIKGKNTRKEYQLSIAGKNTQKKYVNTLKGKRKARIRSIRTQCKRHRNLQWIQMFKNPFDESIKIDYHHINDCYVVAIPRDLHRMYNGKYHREKVMDIVKQIYLGGN